MCDCKIFLVFILTLRLTSCHEIDSNLFLDIENIPEGSNSGYEMNYGLNSRKKRDNENYCPASCGSKNHLPVCYCDDLCNYFNDCCLEASKVGQQKTVPLPETTYDCALPYTANKIYPHLKPFGVTLVRNCTQRFQLSSLAEKCFEKERDSNPLHFIPATIDNGLTFANVFCALCNGMEKVVLWDLESNDPALKKMFSNKNLSSLYETLARVKDLSVVPSPAARPRICIRTSPTTTRTTNCSQYEEPVLYDRQVFRNKYCIHENHLKNCSTTFGRSHCYVQCVKEEPVDMSLYITNRSPRVNLYRISFKLKMEYESRKCKADGMFTNSKVKCVRFGCLNGQGVSNEDNCKRFEIYYRNFKLGVEWHYRDFEITLSQVQRYVTVLLYVLYSNKFATFANFFTFSSPTNSTCGFKELTLYTSYRHYLNIQDVEKLRAWLTSLQITYTEISTNGDSQLIERLYTDKLYKTNAAFRNKCRSKRISFQEDKELLIRALARYHTPFLFNFTCNHVHLTLSISDKTDGRGKTHRQYKPTEFYCVNGQSWNTISIWSTLSSLFCISCIL